MYFRYCEKFPLTTPDKPWEEIERAHYIWSLDRRRAKLEEERAEAKTSKARPHG